MKKKLTLVVALILMVCTLTACGGTKTDGSAGNEMASKSNPYSFSDVLYTSDMVFTCHKPKEYEIVEKGNGLIEINGNMFDDRVYFKRYTIELDDVIYSADGKPVSEITVDEFYKDAFSEAESTIEALKEDTEYLAMAYIANGNYTMIFSRSFVELDENGDFAAEAGAMPWTGLDDVKYTFSTELAGEGNYLSGTLDRMKTNFELLYGEDKYSTAEGFNYKLYSAEYLASGEYGGFAGEAEMANALNTVTAGGDYLEIVAYPNGGSAPGHAMRYDLESGEAVMYSAA